MLVAPAALRASEKARKQVTTGTPKQPAFPARLTAYGALSPVSGLFSHRRPKIITRDLIPASGDQDHASLPYASAALV
jgi:hypothetical protein